MNQQNNHSNLIVIGVVIVVLAIAGWSVYALQKSEDGAVTSNTSDSSTNSSNEQGEQTAPTQNQNATITFTDEGFTPREITVQRGTAITIKNDSSESVQFSSDNHPAHRDNTEMNLETLSPGESSTFMAKTPGTWGYHDHLDDSKTGTVTVKE